MKIGFVLDDSLDRPDGVQQYVLTLGAWLVTQGHDVHYLVGETKRRDIPNVHSLARNIQVRFNRNGLSIPLPARMSAIKKLLARENFDILHVQMPFSPWLAGRVIKSAPQNTAVVGTFHILPFGKRERAGARLLGLVLRKYLRRFETIFSVSEPARDFAARAFHIKSDVLPNAVDIKRFRRARPIKTNNGLQLVFLGRLVRRKGCAELIEALSQLKDVPDYNLIVAGRGPEEASLKRQVKSLGLENKVSFAGYVSEDAKPALLASADLAIFPSTGGESFGIVLIEAMAAGAGVVLAGQNPGYGSVLGSMLEVMIDPNRFVRQLQEFMLSPARRNRTHEAQQRLVKDYDVAAIGAKLFAHYESAIAKRRRRGNN